MGVMKERMRRGELYSAKDPELSAELDGRQSLVQKLNSIRYERTNERWWVLKELLGDLGEGVEIRSPFFCDFGDGITIGEGTFINSNCTMLDCASIAVGRECLIASSVQLVTATHPVDPVARRADWEMAMPITLADGVWLGAGAIVCPGVSIGEDTVVGAGAIVTRDLPAGVVAHGNPARVIREIGESDRVEIPEL
jgi:maltose O-acetyltransferase